MSLNSGSILILTIGLSWVTVTSITAQSAICLPALAAESSLVFFSPHGGATQAIVREINDAKNLVQVQAYSFTSQSIARALVEARKRGLTVEVILDKSQQGEKYSAADFAINAGITTYVDSRHAIAHNKIMILDGKILITGSFNFTKAAEEVNAENLLIIRESPGLLAKYVENFDQHKSHSDLYGGKNGE
jgi:phosphatidylserine/phosphatidylglycerophosphate/cardiolipin synthase-like enzyme